MSKAPKFKPHYNRELGNKYYSEKDYYSDMKKAGLEPYDPNSVKRHAPKPYVQSEWAKGMVNDIHERHGRPPGGRFLEELRKRCYTQESANEARRIADERR